MKAILAGISLAALLAAPALAQKAKDTLRYPMSEAQSTLDQYVSPGSFHYSWAPSVYDNLLGFDPRKGEFLPLLAKSWSQPTPATYEFELKDGVKWHDGETVDADDVVYTLTYLIDPKVNLRFKANWTWIESVEKLGPHKVRVTAKRPVPDGLMWMVGSTPIYPEHVHAPLANKIEFGARPVGTGPYKVLKLDKNTGILAEKSPGFVDSPAKRAGTIGRIVSEPIPDAGTTVAALMTGAIDLADEIPPDQSLALRDSGRFEITLAPPSLSYTFMGFPSLGWQNVKALGDVRVRTAIIKAIDRTALMQTRYGALAAGIPPAEALCSKEQLGCGYTKTPPAYDPAGAKKLLAEAGYGDGFDVSITCFPNDVAEATVISGMLRQVGIRATVRPHQVQQRVQMLSQGKVDIGFYGWSGGALFEVSSQLARHFQSKEYDDPVLTKMATDAGALLDDAARRRAVAKVFDHATDNAYAFAMVPIRRIFVHTKEVRLTAQDEMRPSSIAAHEFAWK